MSPRSPEANVTPERSLAEECFNTQYGHYPIRAELPDPTQDPQLDALIARWARRDEPPKFQMIKRGRA